MLLGVNAHVNRDYDKQILQHRSDPKRIVWTSQGPRASQPQAILKFNLDVDRGADVDVNTDAGFLNWNSESKVIATF